MPDTQDFLDLDAALTDEERAIRDTVRAFAAAELARTSPTGTNTAPCPTTWPAPRGRWGCWACT